MTELLIVIALMGFVMVALAGIFSVIVRTSPSTEARTDDSRSLLGLTNWLSQDVASTAENGFTRGDATTGCLVSSVPASRGLLELRWFEGSSTYVANYRYVAESSNTGSIHRFSCLLGQAATDLKVTSVLDNTTGTTEAPAPVNITLVPTTMVNGTSGNKGLQFEVIVLDDNGVKRELLSLDATTTNVLTTLPPVASSTSTSPSSSSSSSATNQPPTAASIPVSAIAGQPVNFDLPASDPENLTLTVTAFTGVPSGWILPTTPFSGVNVTLTPAASATTGATIGYTVTDAGGLTASSTIVVTITTTTTSTAPNLPPTASPVSQTASTVGTQFALPLIASDPEGGPLTVSFSNVPAGWTVTNTGLTANITPTTNQNAAYTFTYTVTDNKGATASSTITVNVCWVTMSISPTSVNKVTGNQSGISSAVTVNITRNNACGALTLNFTPNQNNEQSVAFNSSTQLVIGATTYSPWSTGVHAIDVRQGQLGRTEATANLTVN